MHIHLQGCEDGIKKRFKQFLAGVVVELAAGSARSAHRQLQRVSSLMLPWARRHVTSRCVARSARGVRMGKVDLRGASPSFIK